MDLKRIFWVFVTLACSSFVLSQPARPNILFILADDLNLAEVAFMPHVSQLIKNQGLHFDTYFASESLCCPSRATTLRGQYAHNTGVLNNGEGSFQAGGFAAAQKHQLERSTIGTWLQDAGYHTALVGKYLNGYPGDDKPTYVPPGWTDWYSPSEGTPYSNFDYTLNENGSLKRYGSRPEDYGTDVYARIAADIIRKSADASEPFFIYFAPFAPHVPDIPVPRFADEFLRARAPRDPAYNERDVSDKPAFIRERPPMSPQLQRAVDELYRRRLQTLQAVDEAAENLVAVLRETGQLKNTYVIFASDNGYHLGQHRLPAGKRASYETDIRLPLFVRGPAVPKGQTRRGLVGNIDLAPSLAALAGVTPPDFVDGRSFVPLLQRETRLSSRRTYLLEHWTEGKIENKQARRGVDEPFDHDLYQNPVQAHPYILRGEPARNPELELPPLIPEAKGIPGYYGLRTARYAYTAYTTGEKELYDMMRDPYQLHNLATKPSSRELIRALDVRAAALRHCRAARCRVLENLPIELH